MSVRGSWPSPPPGILLAGGSVVLWCIYTLVLAVATSGTLLSAAADALVSVATCAGLSVIVHSFLKHGVMHRAVQAQVVAHTVLAPAFAVTWYSVIVMVFAFDRGLEGLGFQINAFSRPAFAWQIFQGLTLYGFVAAVCYAIRGGREAAAVTIVDAPPLERYLTRIGDEVRPVEVRDIVSIAGAQDYSEVVTVSGGRHLVRMSLAEFEARLERRRFIRVHRSAIVNLDYLSHAESAGGGRMLVEMRNGEVLKASRAGTQLLRNLIV